MAPVDKSKPTSDSKKPNTVIDDEDKWTELLGEKEENDSPAKVQIIPPVTLPSSLGCVLPNPHWSVPMNPLPRPEQFGQVTEQQKLESELLRIAEVKLGITKACRILETYLLDRKLTDGPYELTWNDSLNAPGQIVNSPANRSTSYSIERSQGCSALRDMGYLIGLNRAVKILRNAVEEEDQNDDKLFAVRVMTLSRPPNPFPPQLPVPQPIFSPTTFLNEQEIKKISNDIAKEVLREYKEEKVSSSMEVVQTEMIKLCRDVSLNALHRKG